MPHRIDMDGINMAAEVDFIANLVFPEACLPDRCKALPLHPLR
jgi:hypothetical protein